MKPISVFLFVTACGLGNVSKAMELTSTAFANKSEIPVKYTCEGNDQSPPLAWTGAPKNTKSFALIVDDPDAPDPASPQRTWVHWVLYNLPPSLLQLPEGIKNPPEAASAGMNDWNRGVYGGPCPPIGRHRYFFKLFALDKMLTLHKPDKGALEKAMEGHILGQATLLGTYQKHR